MYYNIALFKPYEVMPLQLFCFLTGVTEVDPDLDVLFKQWFDNVEDYFKRKRRREEIQRRNNVKSTTEKI